MIGPFTPRPQCGVAIATRALLFSLLCACSAWACETLDRRPEAARLATREPVMGEAVRLLSGFGVRRHPLTGAIKLHTGVDWGAPLGTLVAAAQSGRVELAGSYGAYGNAVRIDHGAGWKTVYAHLLDVTVRVGQCVGVAAVIGTVGAGHPFGPRLHFEVLRNARYVDPLQVAIGAEATDDAR
jgi:murein DD-endopeptidase MepM/ murein hydrolase activator NlpD